MMDGKGGWRRDQGDTKNCTDEHFAQNFATKWQFTVCFTAFDQHSHALGPRPATTIPKVGSQHKG